jgi:Zn-finger nucleic acid-binding protein
VKCLGCRRKMVEKSKETPRGLVYYDVCDACGGIWFDVGEMDAMVLQLYESVEKASRDRAEGVSEPPRKCPRCKNQWLDKVFFLAYSQILLDHCEKCHGFWLDGGEFKRINRELADLKSRRGPYEKGLQRMEPLSPFLNPLDLIWAFFLDP